MDRDRLCGIALFLFIPLVLVLFTQPPPPLNPGLALILGVAIMLSHRFVAEPWVLRRALQRSLWSGATLPDEAARLPFEATRGERRYPFLTGNDRELRHVRSFARFVNRHGVLLRLFILLPLAVFVLSTFLTEVLSVAWLANQRTWSLVLFQGAVALAVVITALLYRFEPPGDEGLAVPFPFPIHNLALLGIRNTLMVFAGVGVWWLVLAVLRTRSMLA